MLRVVRHLAIEQARLGARVFAIAWGLATLAGIVLAALDGNSAGGGDLTAFIARVGALAFVPAVGVAAPLAVVMHAVRLRDDGERVALAVGGIAPVVAMGAVVAPWLPLLALVPDHVHNVRPAASAGLVDQVVAHTLRDPVAFGAVAERQGIAVDVRDGRLRLLTPLRGGAFALELAADAVAAGGEHVGPGRVAVVDADGAVTSSSFTDLVRGAPRWIRPLAARDESELSTAFVDRAFWRYVHARASAEPMSELWSRERRRRVATLPCLGFALGLAALCVGRGRGGSFVAWVGFGLPAIAIAAIGPRLLGAW